MRPNDSVGDDHRQQIRDPGADIGSVNGEAFIAQTAHQLRPRLGNPEAVAPTRLVDRGRESIARQRRDHEKRIASVCAVSDGIGERADQPQKLHRRGRPPVDQQRLLPASALVPRIADGTMKIPTFTCDEIGDSMPFDQPNDYFELRRAR